MGNTIQPDVAVQQELARRGVDSSVGVFGDHCVQIGKGAPVRLDAVKSAEVPYAGFRTATKVDRGQTGIRQTADAALATLARPGALDAEGLLGLLKAQQTHLERLDKLKQLTAAQQADTEGYWMFTKSVASLSNAELSAVYQKFTSAEMDLLMTALVREGGANPKADDARVASTRLFALQALVLKEVSNRVSTSRLTDLRAANPNDATLGDANVDAPRALTDQYGAGGAGGVAAGHAGDMTAANLGVLANVAARSATVREHSSAGESVRLGARGVPGVSPREMGDVLRAAPLTINVFPDILLGDNSVFAHPDEPIKNIWHLAEQGVKPKGDGYLAKRESVEETLFPEMAGHARVADERPVYGALNVQGSRAGAALPYGSAYIVLKPEVARRATYSLNDSFFATRVSITPERRADFYRLLDGAAGVPQGLKDALRDAGSQVRRDMDAWLDRIAATPDATLGDSFCENAGPASVRAFLDEVHDDISNREGSFLGLLIKCFGDRASTRPTMATHDNLESLLVHLDDVGGNALARAALEQKSGQAPKAALQGAGYIEAQIHGPIVPTRDIAEIHVNIQDIPRAERQAARDKMRLFEESTGIKVVVDDFRTDKVVTDQITLEGAQNAFNREHVDKKALDDGTRDILANLADRVEGFLADPANARFRQGLADGVELKLDGAILHRIETKFLDTLRSQSAQDHSFTAQFLLDRAFDDAVRSIAGQKRELLDGLEGLRFETPAQKTAFAKWVCASGALKSVEEMKMIHRNAFAQADALRELAAAQPPATAEQVMRRMAEFAKAFNDDIGTYVLGLGPRAEFGQDDKLAEFSRVSSMAVSLLRSGEPPVDDAGLARLRALVDSPKVRGAVTQIGAIANTAVGDAADFGNAAALQKTLWIAAEELTRATGGRYMMPRPFTGPVSIVPAAVRDAIRVAAPAAADALERAYPAHPPFPPAADPGRLPADKAGRREFLVGVLEQYRLKELNGEERGVSVHGRGHIVRTFFYATAFCAILKEQGVFVDENAVVLGVAGHDLGRGGLGSDVWEAESGRRTGEALDASYGGGAAGGPYKQEIADAIEGVKVDLPDGTRRSVPKSPTLEAQLLNNADSLDIGRTAEFDEKYFDFLRDRDGQISRESKRIRDALVEEADLLQRLTNPLCANRGLINHLSLAAAEARDPQLSAAYAQQKEDLVDAVGAAFVHDAENVGNADYLARFERVIADNRDLFPLLSRYYLDAE